jgi:hypothetical protein
MQSEVLMRVRIQPSPRFLLNTADKYSKIVLLVLSECSCYYYYTVGLLTAVFLNVFSVRARKWQSREREWEGEI